MKFVLRRAYDNGARRGFLSSVDRLPDYNFETPNIVLYTQSGSVPHMTPDVIELLKPQPNTILISMPSILGLSERMQDSPLNIAEFVGLPNFATIASIIDPAKPRLEGFHKKDVLAVQGRRGKQELTADSFMDFIEALRPDSFLALCDGDTTRQSGKKRVTKSTSRSQEMLTRCITRLKESKVLSNINMLTPLEGGFDPESRRSYAEEIKSSANNGIVIDGLGQYGEEVARRDVKDFTESVKASLKPVIPDQVRILHGPWHPRAVLELIELGIDVMDSSYPYIVTEKGSALLLPLNSEKSPPAKRMKPAVIELSLLDSVNADCFEPISSECTCHCCKNHTRAYIHHLLNVKEMLASVLLSIHNTQQYLEFFEVIRQSLDEGSFQALKERF